MANSATNNYVLEMKTVQIAPVRTLMTALKDILLETNIVFLVPFIGVFVNFLGASFSFIVLLISTFFSDIISLLHNLFLYQKSLYKVS